MQNYEIVLIIHPNESVKINLFISKYKKLINKFSGKIYRLEDWGKRQLSYPIKKLSIAHYILINLKLLRKNISFLKREFNLDESIIRNIVLKVKNVCTDSSLIYKEKNFSESEKIKK